jgi:hypothetical protein
MDGGELCLILITPNPHRRYSLDRLARVESHCKRSSGKSATQVLSV